MMFYRSYQSYCHRLQHDTYFLISTSRLNEQVVDKIVLQLNRVYPQILTNEEAEKFRNPKASLHTRLSDLLKHLQKKGDRHCQEFYRALQINAEQLFNDLPSRKILSPVFFLACFSVAAGLALFWYCCNSGKLSWLGCTWFHAKGGDPPGEHCGCHAVGRNCPGAEQVLA
ncbi:caspase recruitment domain-containing protein 19 isoform X4 [Melospiza georgiana]|uniref:caspase recruitment domain-containing protein 19 isoform X4 n=1 Tax=Melospiza georgiana TaxID=44398 RepID=UPI0025ABC685|nr:caspase recruitment domain-containing protein 19 isoform X4 [Melospiza georgiana]